MNVCPIEKRNDKSSFRSISFQYQIVTYLVVAIERDLVLNPNLWLCVGVWTGTLCTPSAHRCLLHAEKIAKYAVAKCGNWKRKYWFMIGRDWTSCTIMEKKAFSCRFCGTGHPQVGTHCLKFFLKNFSTDIIPFCWSLIPLFWSDVSHGFQITPLECFSASP